MTSENNGISMTLRYVPGIDGLRAIAVLAVFLFHLRGSFLPGGFVGVDVFFVISGYVVSGTLAKENVGRFAHFALSFYARRILRIYPALAVCLVVTGLMQTLLIPSSWLSTTSNKTAILAFFGMGNFALTWFDDGYFAPRTEFNAYTHTWSLGVEEQFYLIFPVLFFVWLKWREQRGWTAAVASGLLPALLLASLLYSWHETGAAPDHAYYWVPSRFWELASGAMLFRWHAQGRFIATSTSQKNGLALIGLTLIALTLVFCDAHAFPFPWALLPVVGTLFIVASVVDDAGGKWALGRLLDNRCIVYVGKASYSLYLWHWPVIVMFRWTVGLEHASQMACAAAIAVILSLMSYHLVERPIRQHKFLLAQPDIYVVSRGMIGIAGCALVVLACFKTQSYLSLSVTRNKIEWYPENWSAKPDVLKASFDEFRGHRIFVLGDSHAGAYATLLQMLADQHGLEVRQYSKGGCSVAALIKATSVRCAEYNREAVEHVIAEARPGDIVFLASLRMNRLGDQWATFDQTEADNRQASAAAAAQRAIALREADALITSFENAGLTAIIDAPKPVFRSPAFRCADWFNKDNPVCRGGSSIARSFLLRHRAPVMTSLGQLARMHPKLVIWDPFPILCPGETCSAYDHGRPLFFDGDHLSGYGNRVLYPSFVAVLETIWQPAPLRVTAQTKPQS